MKYTLTKYKLFVEIFWVYILFYILLDLKVTRTYLDTIQFQWNIKQKEGGNKDLYVVIKNQGKPK